MGNRIVLKDMHRVTTTQSELPRLVYVDARIVAERPAVARQASA